MGYAGFERGEGRREGRIGALLVGYYEGADLIVAGKVGTGFTDGDLAQLEQTLVPLQRPDSPFAKGRLPADSIFVEPRLVAELEFTEWTSSGRLRHPSYKGLRTDKDPRQVVHEGRPPPVS